MIAPRSCLTTGERTLLLDGLGYTKQNPTQPDRAAALRAALVAFMRKREARYLECQRMGRKFCLEDVR